MLPVRGTDLSGRTLTIHFLDSSGRDHLSLENEVSATNLAALQKHIQKSLQLVYHLLHFHKTQRYCQNATFVLPQRDKIKQV